MITIQQAELVIFSSTKFSQISRMICEIRCKNNVAVQRS